MEHILMLLVGLNMAGYVFWQSQDAANGFGMDSLPYLMKAESRQVSPENPTGEKGKGGMAIPDPSNPDLPFSARAAHLGQGRKVRPFIKHKAGETVTIMDVQGPGVITHIWMATEMNFSGNGRGRIIRVYWDDEMEPSVEVPLTDFFAIGHDKFARVNSLPVVVNPSTSLNCYWLMPFRKKVKIMLTNDNSQDLNLMKYHIDYQKMEVG